MKDGCIFCSYSGPNPIIYRPGSCLVFKPLTLKSPGHVLVVPGQHVERFSSSVEVAADLSSAIVDTISYLGMGGRCTITIHEGKPAGQKIPHLHAHLVPVFIMPRGGRAQFHKTMEPA